jgi:hypothetical protein
MADQDYPTYDPTPKPWKPTDLGWKNGYMEILVNNNIVKCNLCGKVTQEGINRYKEHLAGTGEDATSYPRASTEVKREMWEYLEEHKRSQPLDDDVVEVDVAWTAKVQGSTTRQNSGTTAKRNKRAFAVRVCGNKVQFVAAKSVASMLGRKPKDVVDERRSRCSQSTMESSTKIEEEKHCVNM